MILALLGRKPEEIQAEARRFGLRLSDSEWAQILEALGRDPTLAEGLLFDVSFSEHCSYKSSRPLLKQHLPPLASHVVLGPGEDAGAVSLGHWAGEEWVLVVAHESHNHPSQVLPVEGAATGVGGIVRDVYCMGVDVQGVMDSLRFGDPAGPNGERVRAIARGVVRGISEYGNALGVPNLGGETVFHEDFDDNCLVNIVAFGAAPRRRLIRSRVPERAHTHEYALILVGKPTDASGLGGASFASQVLDEAEAQVNRGAVQVHDPFLKRVLVEATKEVWRYLETHAIEVGCKDLGAGGLGGASSELVFAGGFGAEIDLNRVSRALPDLGAHEVLCAETQERFVWAVPHEHAAAICAIFEETFDLGGIYPGAGARVVGRVTSEQVYRCSWNGEVVVDLPRSVLETAPRVDRPLASRTSALPELDPPPPEASWSEWLVARLTDLAAASREAIYRYYDAEVQGLAFVRPGEAGAGVYRPIPGQPLGIAVSTDGNPWYGDLDPYWGGALAVLEAARNVVAAGAKPLALTDCLNFGNPEDPIALGDLDRALRGMADASRAVGSPEHPEEPLPIVSGNVSLYNHSATGRAIPPSPIVACFGLLDDIRRTPSPKFLRGGEQLIVVGRRERAWGSPRISERGGRVPRPDLTVAARELRTVQRLISEGRVSAAQDIADGGLLRVLFEMSTLDGPTQRSVGARCDLSPLRQACGLPTHELLLSESPGFLLAIASEHVDSVLRALRADELPHWLLGVTLDVARIEFSQGPIGESFAIELESLRADWRRPLEALLFHGSGA